MLKEGTDTERFSDLFQAFLKIWDWFPYPRHYTSVWFILSTLFLCSKIVWKAGGQQAVTWQMKHSCVVCLIYNYASF